MVVDFGANTAHVLCAVGHTNKLRFLFEENSGYIYSFLFAVVNYFMVNRLTWCRLRVVERVYLLSEFKFFIDSLAV